jgi:DNA-binding NarL/FixJ family response regulator
MAYRLLIVPGDNEDLRTLQGQLADDIEVRVLDSANDALWEVRNSPPEVIVADVELPGMSGLDMAEILPNFGVPTRVVLWSRALNPQAAEQAASHGVHRFLHGPLSPSELHAALYEALGWMEGGAPAPTQAEFAAAPAPPAPEPATPEPIAAAEQPERTRRERIAAAAAAAPPERAPDRSRRERPTTPAPQPANPPAAAAPPPRKPSTRPRGGSIVLTADSLKPIRGRMEALSQDIGSQCILLANRAGMVLAEVGITSSLPTMILLPLLSTSFSTAGQISQMLREEDSTALYMQEGNRYDLYCFDILQSFMLVIVFDKSGLATAKIGSVWVYAKRAIRDMQELLG